MSSYAKDKIIKDLGALIRSKKFMYGEEVKDSTWLNEQPLGTILSDLDKGNFYTVISTEEINQTVVKCVKDLTPEEAKQYCYKTDDCDKCPLDLKGPECIKHKIMFNKLEDLDEKTLNKKITLK